MKRIFWLWIVLALILGACNSNKVKVRGKVAGLTGTVKLLAEMPGQEGLAVVAQQEVTDGDINLVTEAVQIPARVWVDLDGKRRLEFIVDTKDQIWIQGKAQFINEVEVKGSGLGAEYAKLKKLFKEKYEGPIEPIDNSIEKILAKEKQTKDDEVMLGIYRLQKQRYIRARANYAKTLIEANPGRELSLFLMKDELQDSLELQKRLFKTLSIQNKESNIYKNLAAELQ